MAKLVAYCFQPTSGGRRFLFDGVPPGFTATEPPTLVALVDGNPLVFFPPLSKTYDAPWLRVYADQAAPPGDAFYFQLSPPSSYVNAQSSQGQAPANTPMPPIPSGSLAVVINGGTAIILPQVFNGPVPGGQYARWEL